MVYDVIIAGAGPVGLFLAGELRLAKLSVLVLEASGGSALGSQATPVRAARTLGAEHRAFYRRGLLERIASRPRADEPAAGRPRPVSTASDSPRRGPAGHFAGIQFDYANIDASRWPYRLSGPADMQFGAEMEHLERVLATHALAIGVEIRRGQGVDGLETSGDEVTVHAGEQRFRARWLVGCDGGRSAVHKLGGFELVGTEPELTGYSVQADLADPSMLPMGRHYTPTGMYTQWQPGWIVMADFDGGAFHRTRPITREHVQAVLRRISGADVTLGALRVATTWTDRSQQATTYRKGRVLLAGDAAHIHSPLGGQGLNLGLGDAMNLGWKLATTIRSGAPEGLLDSYTAERHPIGARILEWTRGTGRVDATRSIVTRAPGRPPPSDRHLRWRDLFRRTRLGRVPPLRPRRGAPSGGPQLPRLRARGWDSGRGAAARWEWFAVGLWRGGVAPSARWALGRWSPVRDGPRERVPRAARGARAAGWVRSVGERCGSQRRGGDASGKEVVRVSGTPGRRGLTRGVCRRRWGRRGGLFTDDTAAPLAGAQRDHLVKPLPPEYPYEYRPPTGA